MIKYNYKILALLCTISMVTIIQGCSSVPKCPSRPAIGNAGTVLNSGYNDYLPYVDGDTLYFTSIRDNDKIEVLYKSAIRINGDFEGPVRDTILPISQFVDAGSPFFYTNPADGIKCLYFAGATEEDKAQKDIYLSKFINNSWTRPKAISSINSEWYESQPVVSPDGQYLVFVSDRDGSLGETDLYVSQLSPDGSWGEPENLGNKINTKGKELTPYIADDGSLYYASNGVSPQTGFDIIKAEYLGQGNWGNAKLLPFPINTEADETGPTIWRDKLIIASNRRGGCGSYDIYNFDLCGPAILTGTVTAQSDEMALDGIVELFDENDKPIEEIPVKPGDSFKFKVKPKRNYTLRYKNPCLSEKYYEYKINVPCSDTSVIKIVADIQLPNLTENFMFEEYDVPFFVSGYYQPNTDNNLESLRLKFAYNLIGNNDSTKYIENPGNDYDKYAKTVEKALDKAKDFILNKMDVLNGECSVGIQKIKVTITGYADPRPLSEAAKFSDLTINDEDLNFHVDRGTQMTNKLLSELRAYYTAKYLIEHLQNEVKYTDKKESIEWQVQGLGVNEDKKIKDNREKRRVSIKIELLK